MKQLACKDLGAPDCDFVATGETADEAKATMMAHAQEAHPEVLEGLTPEEMDEKSRMMDALLADEEPAA